MAWTLLLISADEALSEAVESGDLEEARRRLVAGADPTAPSYDVPLLTCALDRGDLLMARLLMEFGADADAIDEQGRSRLHREAAAGDYPQPVRLLLALGLDVAATDDRGWTPLHYAATYGYRAVASVLLDAGADLDAASTDGVTARALLDRN